MFRFGVHWFKGSGVQGSILVPRLDLGCVFTRKASGLKQKMNVDVQFIASKITTKPSYYVEITYTGQEF